MHEQVQIVWEKALSDLKAQVSDQTYTAWLYPLKAVSLAEDILTLSAPNDLFKEWVSERYLPLIKSSVSGLLGKSIAIAFSVDITEAVTAVKSADAASKGKKSFLQHLFVKESSGIMPSQSGVNKKYTFDSFVIGSSNRFAHAAAVAVSESPAKTYNPLFIYGGVGLGKTHLMHAIGNAILSRSPKAKTVYVSSEYFTN